MLKIGDFSRLSRISVRMLRHYDEIGLLKPAKTDEWTGYRYYGEEQLLLAGRISAWKDMGFSLADIGQILSQGGDGPEVAQRLEARRAELMALSRETARRLQLVEAAMKRLREEDSMKYDVLVKTMPERRVASVRQVIPAYEEEGRLWHILFQETAQMGLAFPDPACMCAVLHDQEFKECDADVEVQAAVVGEYPDTEHVRFKTEPAVQVASVTFRGGYEQVSGVYARLAQWAGETGCALRGPMFEIYHVSPHETQNPDEWVTEVCCPIGETDGKES